VSDVTLADQPRASIVIESNYKWYLNSKTFEKLAN
jgi:hypothetical protein